MVLSRYGFISEEIENIYRDLEIKAKRHLGEFILVVARHEAFHGCLGFGREPIPEEYTLDTHIVLGVIKEPGFLIDSKSGDCKFTTQKYASYSSHSRNASILEKDIDASMFLVYDFGLFMNKSLECKNPFNRLNSFKYLWALEVKVGDEEVNVWFQEQRNRYDKVFQEMIRLLNRLILTSE